MLPGGTPTPVTPSPTAVINLLRSRGGTRRAPALDKWESDCDTPETEGPVARVTRSMSQPLLRRRGRAQAVH